MEISPARRAPFPLRVLAVLVGLVAVVALPVHGQARPGWIGVSVDIRTSGDPSAPRTVVVVTDVQSGGPAALAGIRQGDLLLEIDGLRDAEALRTLDRRLRLRAGEPVRMVVSRDGDQRAFEVVAAEHPGRMPPGMLRRVVVGPDPDSLVESIMLAMDSMRVRLARGDGLRVRAPAPPAPGRPLETSEAPHSPAPFEYFLWRDADHRPSGAWPAPAAAPDPAHAPAPYSPLTPYVLGRNRVAGAEVIDLQPEMSGYFETETGVLVIEVAPGTPAALAGLLPGDVITHLGSVRVHSIDDLRIGVARAGSALDMGIVRRGEAVRVTLRR